MTENAVMMTENDVRADVAALLDRASTVLVDFNGTLSDDEELIADLVVEIAVEEFGVVIDRDRYFEDLVGQTEAAMFAILAREAAREHGIDVSGVDTSGALVAKFNRRYLDRVSGERRISPAAEDFVRAAKARGKAVGVVTAASKAVVVPTLNQLDLLEVIDAVVALEDVEHSKPEPDCYLLALGALETDPSDAVVFEDSRTGLASARAAGIVSVVVGDALPETERSEYTEYAVSELRPELFER
ncbi:HAD family hydrolase [Leucobacter sp. GX24907]